MSIYCFAVLRILEPLQCAVLQKGRLVTARDESAPHVALSLSLAREPPNYSRAIAREPSTGQMAGSDLRLTRRDAAASPWWYASSLAAEQVFWVRHDVFGMILAVNSCFTCYPADILLTILYLQVPYKPRGGRTSGRRACPR
jgi:hypothetical protein